MFMSDKNQNLQIFTITHKMPPYGLEDSSFRTPLQVGKENNQNDPICDVIDNTGSNISYKNTWYTELTGVYWIWKNTNYNIKGCEHYRRRFDLTPEEISNILNEHDVIMFNHYNFYDTVFKQYSDCHNGKDLELCKTIIDELYPTLSTSFNQFIFNDTILYPCNSFITKKEVFDIICEILFNILFEYENRVGLTNHNDWLNYAKSFYPAENNQIALKYNHPEITCPEYQMRVCGFLGERLITLITRSMFPKIYESNMIKLENI